MDLGFPVVVANEISSNAFLGTPIPTRPRDAFIRVVGGTNPRGCRCPQVSPNKGVEGVGLRFGHTTRTQERAQRLQVWKGRKRNLRISEGAQNLRILERTSDFRVWGGACTVGWGSAGSTAWPCSGWGHRCGADYGKFCKTMPRDVQKRQNCPDFVCSQELRCPPRPPLWGVQGDGDCHSVPGRGWGLCGDTPGLGQGHPGPHGEVWVAKVPTVCVCSGRSELS